MKIRNLLQPVSRRQSALRVRIVPQWYLPRREILSPAIAGSLAGMGLVRARNGAWVSANKIQNASESVIKAVSSDFEGMDRVSGQNVENGGIVASVDDRLTVLDLFAGIGGFSLGLHMTGHYRTVGFVEINPFCQKVLAKNFPNTPIFGDIRDVTDGTLSGLGRIDVITAGFPCQPFSQAGKRNGTEDERFLWQDIFRIAMLVKPRILILENVPGIFTTQKGLVLAGVLYDLTALGYDTEWGVIPASAAGAAHERERFYCIATLSNSQRQRGHVGGRQRENSDQSIIRGKESVGGSNPTKIAGYSQVKVVESSRDGSKFIQANEGSDRNHYNRERDNSQSEPGRVNQQSWANGSGKSLQRNSGGVKPGLGRNFNGVSDWLDKYRLTPIAPPGFEQYPHEPPRVIQDLPNRKDRVEALGNAVVPQVIAAIGQCVWRWYVQLRRVRAFASGRVVDGAIEVQLAGEGR